MNEETDYRRSDSDQATAQEQLVPFLLAPDSFPHRPGEVRLIQTHASFVFIAPPFVYKIKKAVDFGFLDFSTLEKRRYFCHREVELNRRLTRDVYLEVLPISRKNGTFFLGDDEQIVEYAVKMRMLSEDGFLDFRLARGEIANSDLDRISAVLRMFYVGQHPSREVEERGRISALRVSTDENFRQTEGFVGKTLSRPAYDAIRHYVERWYSVHEELFEARVREGRILDCHGDLHLEHIHLTPQALNIYDCIEFNDRFRYVDVASDTAFLAMDLDFQGRRDLSRYFIERVASDLDDPGMLPLMDFYKCYRAYVRGKVESLHGVAHAALEEERRSSAALARRYFLLALQYAVAGSQPLVVVIMGGVASGKSTLAGILARELDYDLCSSDRTRKELAGVPLHERGTSTERDHLYSREMSAETYAALLLAAEKSALKGRGCVLDATFGRQLDRDELRRHLDQLGTACCFLEAQAGNEMLRRRLAGREEEPDVISDARLEDFQTLSARYESPSELSSELHREIDTSSSVEEAVSEALRFLAERQVSLV